MAEILTKQSGDQIRKGRGLEKKLALISTSIRLPKEVMDFFELFPDNQSKMWDVITEYVMFQNKNNR
jgi:hypothetical protein